ncbi:predicted protein [Coccidioides posadasii str. Silveira]|uniref:Predicted protein n=1 Tax=Coccidioides posadasii (strain RMSCC 757 / Silveira) TaxID=443226 RepID=E9DBM7_COCPS|nr:predicted protein [Coccidioides posadasii str. Silveira]
MKVNSPCLMSIWEIELDFARTKGSRSTKELVLSSISKSDNSAARLLLYSSFQLNSIYRWPGMDDELRHALSHLPPLLNFLWSYFDEYEHAIRQVLSPG